MKITIESTDRLTFVNGTQVRAWKGVSERGVACIVFVANIAVEKTSEHAQFERELKETMPPASVFMSLAQVLDG